MKKYTFTIATRGLYSGGGGVFIRKIIINLAQSRSTQKIYLISDAHISDNDISPSIKDKIMHFPVRTLKGGFLTNYPYFFIKSFFCIKKYGLERVSDIIIANNSVGIVSRKKISILHNSQLLLALGYCKKIFLNPAYNIVGFIAHNVYIFFDFFDFLSSSMTYCVGEDTFRTYNSIFKKKISRINNFLISKRLSSKINKDIQGRNKVIIFMASRLEPLKGILDTCSILSDKKRFIESQIHKKIEIRVAGFGSEEEKIKKIKDIKFLGKLSPDDINSQLQKSDIFILPSYHDNFPTILLEGLLYGHLLLVKKSSGQGKYLLRHNSQQIFSNLNELPSKIINLSSFPLKTKKLITKANHQLLKPYVFERIPGDLSSIIKKLGGKKF